MFLLSLRVENFCHYALLVLPRLDDTLRRKGLDKIKYCEASMNLPGAAYIFHLPDRALIKSWTENIKGVQFLKRSKWFLTILMGYIFMFYYFLCFFKVNFCIEKVVKLL